MSKSHHALYQKLYYFNDSSASTGQDFFLLRRTPFLETNIDAVPSSCIDVDVTPYIRQNRDGIWFYKWISTVISRLRLCMVSENWKITSLMLNNHKDHDCNRTYQYYIVFFFFFCFFFFFFFFCNIQNKVTVLFLIVLVLEGKLYPYSKHLRGKGRDNTQANQKKSMKLKFCKASG